VRAAADPPPPPLLPQEVLDDLPVNLDTLAAPLLDADEEEAARIKIFEEGVRIQAHFKMLTKADASRAALDFEMSLIAEANSAAAARRDPLSGTGAQTSTIGASATVGATATIAVEKDAARTATATSAGIGHLL